MTFVIFHYGFENGPTERYEFKMPLQGSQGPSWSTNALVELAPTILQLVPRCRAMHPDHDCQCTGVLDHKGGYQSKHHCWHNTNGGWPAWRRGKRDLIRVPDKRTLEPGGVYTNEQTREIRIEGAHING